MSSAPADRPTRVLFACCGLEHAHRGYESFARECFDTLKDDPRLEMTLVKGTGASGDRERAVPSLKRDDVLTQVLARALRRRPLVTEQLAFSLSLQGEIRRTRPDVIYFSEFYTGVGLDMLRRLNRRQYALVLSNGSMAFEGFERFDRVHQHTAPALDFVLARGADPAKQTLLPVGFAIGPRAPRISEEERAAIRRRFDLPVDRRIVVSVAALNRSHKRLDHLITELGRLPEPRPYLLLVGQPEPETAELRRLASERLGDEGHGLRTVPHEDVLPLLRTSDEFVLASLAEGLPRALVEAMAQGLPCVCHDYPIAHYALGPHGRLVDMTETGALAARLREDAEGVEDPDEADARAKFVYERFSWDVLREQYVELLRGAAGRRDFRGVPAGAA